MRCVTLCRSPGVLSVTQACERLQKKQSINKPNHENMKEKTRKTRSIIFMLSAAGMVGAVAGSAQGGTPSVAMASSEFSASYGPGNLIDNSGLSGSAPHTIYETHSELSATRSWLSDGSELPQTVTFDLG